LLYQILPENETSEFDRDGDEVVAISEEGRETEAGIHQEIEDCTDTTGLSPPVRAVMTSGSAARPGTEDDVLLLNVERPANPTLPKIGRSENATPLEDEVRDTSGVLYEATAGRAGEDWTGGSKPVTPARSILSRGKGPLLSPYYAITTLPASLPP